MSGIPEYLNKALKFLKERAGLEPEYGVVEITCEGIADHMTMFSCDESSELKKSNEELVKKLGSSNLFLKMLADFPELKEDKALAQGIAENKQVIINARKLL